jgi:hypothetical protein
MLSGANALDACNYQKRLCAKWEGGKSAYAEGRDLRQHFGPGFVVGGQAMVEGLRGHCGTP